MRERQARGSVQPQDKGQSVASEMETSPGPRGARATRGGLRGHSPPQHDEASDDAPLHAQHAQHSSASDNSSELSRSSDEQPCGGAAAPGAAGSRGDLLCIGVAQRAKARRAAAQWAAQDAADADNSREESPEPEVLTLEELDQQLRTGGGALVAVARACDNAIVEHPGEELAVLLGCKRTREQS